MATRRQRQRKLKRMTDDELLALGEKWKPAWDGKDRDWYIGKLLKLAEKVDPVNRDMFDRLLGLPTKEVIEAGRHKTLVSMGIATLILMVAALVVGIIPLVRGCGGP